MQRTFQYFLSIFILFLFLGAGGASAQTTRNNASTFTYQGYLELSGSPVSDTCDFTFVLMNAPTGGAMVDVQSVNGVPVSDGIFSVDLTVDWNAFGEGDRYLEITVDCGSGSQTLSPRQPITPAPVAMALPAIQTEPNATDGTFTSPNIIAGYVGNGISTNSAGSVIAGGGIGGNLNFIDGSFNAIGGGYGNRVNQVNGATVSGGFINQANGYYSAIGGGSNNRANGRESAVGGGASNRAAGDYATIAGGGPADDSTPTTSANTNNHVYDDYGTIGGGGDNHAGSQGSVQDNDPFATVSGGGLNRARGGYSAIGGGYDNNADGLYSTIAGGSLNTANGNYSFAAGYQAKANNTGSFVWADSNGFPFYSSGLDTFRARATGGVEFVTGIDSSGLTTAGVEVPAGGTGWNAVSDQTLKSEITPVDTAAVLDEVANMPVSEWQFTEDESGTRYIGPMAQDFYAAFGLGEDDTTINSVNMDGVTLAAIQGLHAENEALAATVEQMETRITELEQLVSLKQSGINVLGLLLAASGGFWLARRKQVTEDQQQ